MILSSVARRSAPGIVAFVGLLGLAGSAAAQDDVEPFRVLYDAPRSCPGVDDFSYQLQARTRRLVKANGGEPATSFVVNISEGERGFEGKLLVAERDGATTERLVPGSDCAEVLSAMALIGAVLIDPSASVEALPPAPLKVTQTRSDTKRPGPKRPARRPPAAWSVGYGLTLQSDIAPDPLPGIMVYLDYEATQSPGLGLYVRTELHATRSLGVDGPSNAPGLDRAQIQFTWGTVRAVGCPWNARLGSVALRPCLFGDIGVLHGQGYAVPEGSESSVLWAAVGALARLDFSLLDRVHLGISAGASKPIERVYGLAPEYGPPRTVHEVTGLAAHADLSFGVRFF